MKKKIALIFGSINNEHDISVASAASVFEYFPYDLYDMVPIYIAKTGVWYTGNYSLEAMKTNTLNGEKHSELWLKFDPTNPGFIKADDHSFVKVDGAFIMLHGRMGEGGEIQGLLNSANIPFTGCDTLSAAVCMDKYFTHIICESIGIPMAPFKFLTKDTAYDPSDFEYPLIVKPTREGSSYGVTYVESADKLVEAVNTVFTFDDRILIEGYIKGTEVGIGILKTKHEYIIGDMDQVNVSGDIFDFQEKYHPHATETLRVSEFPMEVQEQVKAYSRQIFEVLDARLFGRLDFFIDKDHNIFFNEINTIPGFTSTSRYPNMIDTQGIDYPNLIIKMIEDIL